MTSVACSPTFGTEHTGKCRLRYVAQVVLSTLSVLSIRVMITSNALIRSLSQARSIGWEVIVDDRPESDAAPSLTVPSFVGVTCSFRFSAP